MRPTIYFILLCLVCGNLAASGQKTTVRGLRTVKTPAHATEPYDTVDVEDSDSLVRFSGYEKSLRATRETVFVTNLAERGLSSITATISYFDNAGRLLHSRHIELRADIPPGETRRIDFPSWDTQKSFYYRNGPHPRISAIPYTITITPTKILYDRTPD